MCYILYIYQDFIRISYNLQIYCEQRILFGAVSESLKVYVLYISKNNNYNIVFLEKKKTQSGDRSDWAVVSDPNRPK